MKRLFLLISVMAILCVATPAFGAEPIKIGVYNSLTGANAVAGIVQVDGTKLAARLAPEVLGRPVELVILDNKSDVEEAAKAVRSLIEDHHVVAIIGTSGSSLAISGGNVSETFGIPAVGTTCTNPLVTKDKKYYFRVAFTDPDQGDAAAKYAYEKLNSRNAAILMDKSSDYSVGLGGLFEKKFKQ